jgi:hypothetical protein
MKAKILPQQTVGQIMELLQDCEGLFDKVIVRNPALPSVFVQSVRETLDRCTALRKKLTK